MTFEKKRRRRPLHLTFDFSKTKTLTVTPDNKKLVFAQLKKRKTSGASAVGDVVNGGFGAMIVTDNVDHRLDKAWRNTLRKVANHWKGSDIAGHSIDAIAGNQENNTCSTC
jgi:hypothetical protein